MKKVWYCEVDNGKFTGSFSMPISLTKKAVYTLFSESLLCSPSASLINKMFEQEGEMNVVLVASCLGWVKYHKGNLTARSPVFQAMFQSGMQEVASGSIEVSDMTMTENEVKPFLLQKRKRLVWIWQ